jgi:hypothetical protein
MRAIAPFMSVVAVASAVGVLVADGSSASVGARKPQTVTLETSKTTLKAALGEIKKQTGIEVMSSLSGDPEIVDLNIKNRTFWEAVDAVAAKAHAFVAAYDPVMLQELAEGQEAPPVSYDGLFRVALKRISTSTDLFTGATTCTAVLDVAWEPGGRLFYLIQERDKLKVLDANMNPLKTPGGSKTEQVTGKASWEVEVRLPSVPRAQAKLGLVEGRLRALGTPQMQRVTFDDLTKKNQKQDSGPTSTVTLGNVEQKKDIWNVKLELVHKEKVPQLDSFQLQSWIFHNEITLESGGRNGAKLELQGSDIDFLSGDKAILVYHFKAPTGNQKDWKLTYLTPGMLTDTPIRFSFKDVRLP